MVVARPSNWQRLRTPSGSSTQSPSESSTQTFPDGTKVTFVSATWITAGYPTPDPAVKFTFHIVAGPQWKPYADQQVHLRPGSGDGKPIGYYMVTLAGWSYPNTNSTGYADLSNYVPGPSGQGDSDNLVAGAAVDASSKLVPPSNPSDPQQVVVTIEMPNGQLQSRTFTVTVGPEPFGGSPSGDTSS